MGYFSRLACELDCREDRSYPSPETQLICRIMELEGRLTELSGSRCAICDDRLSTQEIETVLPKHLFRVNDVRRALATAQRELVLMELEDSAPLETEIPGQIRIDMAYMPDRKSPRCAA